MPRPVHFEVHASDPQRAIAFYSQVFGWRFQEYMPGYYWLISTGEQGAAGIDGGLNVREGPAPAKEASPNAFVCTLDVDNVDNMIAAIRQAGGEITSPKHAVPGVGWVIYFRDPDGNLIGAMQSDTNAA